MSCQVVDGVSAPVLQAGPRLDLLHPGGVRGDGGRGLGRCQCQVSAGLCPHVQVSTSLRSQYIFSPEMEMTTLCYKRLPISTFISLVTILLGQLINFELKFHISYFLIYFF